MYQDEMSDIEVLCLMSREISMGVEKEKSSVPMTPENSKRWDKLKADIDSHPGAIVFVPWDI